MATTESQDGACLGHRPPRAAAPSRWVVRFAAHIAPEAPVLDVACGSGRHARLLLARGHPVTAVDRDLSELEPPPGTPGLEAIAADLEAAPWPFAGRTFGAVVVTNYLHRPLFPHLIAALAPGGLLIYETFARGNERFGRPRNPAHLLEEGELIARVWGRLRILAYESNDWERRAVVQRLCAVNDPERAPPSPLGGAND